MLSPFIRTLAPVAILALLSSCNTATPTNPYMGSYEGTFTADLGPQEGTLTLNVAQDGKWTSNISNTTLGNLKGTGSGTVANDGTITGTYIYPGDTNIMVSGKGVAAANKLTATLKATAGTQDVGNIFINLTKK